MATTPKILTVEGETALLQPIDTYMSGIQSKIDELRSSGTTKVLSLQSSIDAIKSDRLLTKQEREQQIAALQKEMDAAKQVESSHKQQVATLIADGEAYLKAHYDKEYLTPVKESCAAERVVAKEKYQKRLAELEAEHKQLMAKTSDARRPRRRSTSTRTSSSMPR